MANCIVKTGNSAGVNVRATKSTSGSKLGVIDNGVTVNVVRCDSTWATLMYNGTPAFVQHQYLSNPPSSNGEGLSAGDSGACNGSNVNVRDAANGNTTGSQLNKGDAVKIYERSAVIGGYYWYRIGANRWVRGDYLTPGTGSSGSSNTTSDDFTDDVKTKPVVNRYYTYTPENAVKYAIAHSSNNSGVADPKRNTSFGEGASNACANFVHQCLLAGGARMFDGWCYKLSGIPSSWDSDSWTFTNKGRRRLLEKGWIERIPYQSVKKGDIVYTYYSDYANRGMSTPFNHVTIAITEYNASEGGCYVCGHTANQNNKFKKLSDEGNQCTYCYRVKRSLGGDGTEKAIDLTDGKSKAI